MLSKRGTQTKRKIWTETSYSQCRKCLFACSMTRLQTQLKSQPQGLSPSSPSALLTQSHYFLPTLNLSVTLPIASSPCLGLLLCHSSSNSPSTHLSIAHPISVNHSALLARLLTAPIDLHLLPVHRRSVLSDFSTYSSNSFSALLHHRTFPSHHFSSLHFISKCLPLGPRPSSVNTHTHTGTRKHTLVLIFTHAGLLPPQGFPLWCDLGGGGSTNI